MNATPPQPPPTDVVQCGGARADQGPRAVDVVARVGALDVSSRRFLGRDVDVERRVVLGHPLVDVLDLQQLGVGERGAVAGEVHRRVAAVRHRCPRVPWAVEVRVPERVAQVVAVEVQVDRLRRVRLAVQQERVGQRERLADDSRRRRLARRYRVDVVGHTGSRDPEVRVVAQTGAQAGLAHPVAIRGPGDRTISPVGCCVGDGNAGKSAPEGRRKEDGSGRHASGRGAHLVKVGARQIPSAAGAEHSPAIYRDVGTSLAARATATHQRPVRSTASSRL